MNAAVADHTSARENVLDPLTNDAMDNIGDSLLKYLTETNERIIGPPELDFAMDATTLEGYITFAASQTGTVSSQELEIQSKISRLLAEETSSGDTPTDGDHVVAYTAELLLYTGYILTGAHPNIGAGTPTLDNLRIQDNSMNGYYLKFLGAVLGSNAKPFSKGSLSRYHQLLNASRRTDAVVTPNTYAVTKALQDMERLWQGVDASSEQYKDLNLSEVAIKMKAEVEQIRGTGFLKQNSIGDA